MNSMEQLDLPNPFHSPILYIPQTRSTMEEAKEYVRRCAAGKESGTRKKGVISQGEESIFRKEACPDRTGVSDGTAVVTDFQGMGRGRMTSRSWISPPGQSILTTLIFNRGSSGDGPRSNMETIMPTLSIRLALSVARYLRRRFGLEAEIKWPNDVMVGGRKISGILCEITAQFVYAGIGINCLQTEFDEEHKDTVTSVCKETEFVGRPVEELPHLLYYIKAVVEQDLGGSDPVEDPAGDPVEDPVREAEKILYRRGEQVSLVKGLPENGTVLEGRLEGLSEGGAVLLRTGDGELHGIISGEFSMRPRQQNNI